MCKVQEWPQAALFLGMNWEELAKETATDSLTPGFSIYGFGIGYVKGAPVIQISLDKETDPYGSPNIADCEQFSHVYDMKLRVLANEGKIPEDYALEVASPGAEREIAVPGDLERFKERPMRVEFTNEEGKLTQLILHLIEHGEESATFKFADVKRNRREKKLKGKKMKHEMKIPFSDIHHVNLHVDF